MLELERGQQHTIASRRNGLSCGSRRDAPVARRSALDPVIDGVQVVESLPHRKSIGSNRGARIARVTDSITVGVGVAPSADVWTSIALISTSIAIVVALSNVGGVGTVVDSIDKTISISISSDIDSNVGWKQRAVLVTASGYRRNPHDKHDHHAPYWAAVNVPDFANDQVEHDVISVRTPHELQG